MKMVMMEGDVSDGVESGLRTRSQAAGLMPSGGREGGWV